MVRAGAPLWFRFARFLERRQLRGGYRIVRVAEQLGGLNCVVRYELGNGVTLTVPLQRRENRWAMADLMVYEQPLVSRLSSAIAQLPRPVTWIDCGADIGAVTALVAASAEAPAAGWAFEPNPVPFKVLVENMSGLHFPVIARRAAVAGFTGRGALLASATDPSDHARYLAPASGGDVEVVRIDDLSISSGGGLAMKIDVEGGELDVLRGAAATLESVPEFVVSFEAHRDVCTRTGIDPSECLLFLQSLRPCTWLVAEAPGSTIDPARSYFEQVRGRRISNVICRTQR